MTFDQVLIKTDQNWICCLVHHFARRKEDFKITQNVFNIIPLNQGTSSFYGYGLQIGLAFNPPIFVHPQHCAKY